MKTIEDLLDINQKHINNLEKNLNFVINRINKDLKDKLLILKEIKDKMNYEGSPSLNKIQNIFREYKELYSKNPQSIRKLDLNKIRILTHSLDYKEDGNPSIFSSTNELSDFLNLLNEKWRYVYLKGLFISLLKNWGSNSDSFRKLGFFVLDKIKYYSENRPYYLLLKKNIRYFDLSKGNVLLGSDIALLNTKISEATKKIDLPDYYFDNKYFSEVIITYFLKMGVEIFKKLDDVDEALRLHKNKDTDKIVISKLIINANYLLKEDLKDKIKEMAIEYIGDPSIDSLWYAGNFSKELKDDIILAKQYLNQWIVKQFISVFFEKCINDERRKQFWLKYSKKIKRIKIFGSRSIKEMLLSVQGLSKYVDSRFNNVKSNQSISAFMFTIENYKFIEFSVNGFALNLYNESNFDSPTFDPRDMIYSVEYLRNSDLPQVVQISGGEIISFNEYGRFFHKDGIKNWEQVLTEWMEKIGNIYV